MTANLVTLLIAIFILGVVLTTACARMFAKLSKRLDEFEDQLEEEGVFRETQERDLKALGGRVSRLERADRGLSET